MLTVITSSVPDIRPAIPASPQLEFDHPAITELIIRRTNINEPPTTTIRVRNYRDLTDDNNNPIYLEDGVTQKAQYAPTQRYYELQNLYEWIAQQSNAAEIVTALNTLLTAVLSYDEAQKMASS